MIVTVAEELNVDLIVIPTHGDKGIAHMILGSVVRRRPRSKAARYSRSDSAPALSVARQRSKLQLPPTHQRWPQRNGDRTSGDFSRSIGRAETFHILRSAVSKPSVNQL